MKRNIIVFLTELFVTQYDHWVLFPLFACLASTISHFIGQEMAPGVYLWPLFAFLPLLFFYMRSVCKNFFFMLLWHGALVALIWILPGQSLPFQLVYRGMALYYAIYSGIKWLKADTPDDGTISPVVAVVLHVACLYLMHYQGIEGWSSLFTGSLIGALGAYLLYYYMVQYTNFLVVNDSSTGHIPEREIFLSGMGMVFGYTLIGMLVLLLTANIEWMRGILAVLKQGLILFLRLIVSLFPDTGEEVQPITETASQRDPGDMMMPEGPTDPALIWVILEWIALIAILVLFVYLLFRLFVFIVRFIKTRTHFRNGIHTEGEEQTFDVREKCSVKRTYSANGTSRFHLLLTPNEKIRQLYRRKVVAAHRQIAGDQELEEYEHLTARECSNRLDIPDIAPLYEQARYSDQPCTREEVKHMKELGRN